MHAPTRLQILSWTFFLLGLSAFALTASGNIRFGVSLGTSDAAQMWQGGTALLIDAASAALAIGCGMLIAHRRITLSIVVGIAALAFASMSAFGLIGLGASERIAKSRTATATSEAALASVQAENATRAGAYERNLTWLRAQATNKRLGYQERKAIREELRQAVATGPDLLPLPAVNPMVDPQAQIVAQRTGWDVEEIQVGSTAALAILLIVSKVLFFWLAGVLRREPIEDEIEWRNFARHAKPLHVVREGLPPVDNSVREGLTRLSFGNPPQSSTQEEDQSSTPPATETEVQRLGAAIREDVNRHVFDQTVLAEFIARHTREARGSKVAAADLYAAYATYASEHNYNVLSQNLFGRLCTLAGLKRVSARRGIEYLDLVLLPSAGSQEGPQALAA